MTFSSDVTDIFLCMKCVLVFGVTFVFCLTGREIQITKVTLFYFLIYEKVDILT